jgi:hypothetical protein
MCRAGFVETARAVGLVAGESVVRRFAQEWPAFGVVEARPGHPFAITEHARAPHRRLR